MCDGEGDVEKSSVSLTKHLHSLSLGRTLEARSITSASVIFWDVKLSGEPGNPRAPSL